MVCLLKVVKKMSTSKNVHCSPKLIFLSENILLTFKLDFETDSVLPFPLLALTFSDLFPGASLVFFKFLCHMSLSEIRQVHQFSVWLNHWHLWIFIQILKFIFWISWIFSFFCTLLIIEVIRELIGKETCRKSLLFGIPGHRTQIFMWGWWNKNWFIRHKFPLIIGFWLFRMSFKCIIMSPITLYMRHFRQRRKYRSFK